MIGGPDDFLDLLKKASQRRLLLLIAEAFLQHHGPQRVSFKIQDREISN